MHKLRFVVSTVLFLAVAIGAYYFIYGKDNRTFKHGETDMQTVKGIDANQDGVRDDIEKYITEKYSTSLRSIAALRQYAKAFQKSLLDRDKESAIKSSNEKGRAWNCLLATRDDASDIILEMRAEILNTTARSEAYINFNSLISGTVLLPVHPDKTACDFNFDSLTN